MFLFRTNLEYVFLGMQILDISLWLMRPRSAIPGLFNQSFCPRLPQVSPSYHEKYLRVIAILIPSTAGTNPKLSAFCCWNPQGTFPQRAHLSVRLGAWQLPVFCLNFIETLRMSSCSLLLPASPHNLYRIHHVTDTRKQLEEKQYLNLGLCEYSITIQLSWALWTREAQYVAHLCWQWEGFDCVLQWTFPCWVKTPD